MGVRLATKRERIIVKVDIPSSVLQSPKQNPSRPVPASFLSRGRKMGSAGFVVKPLGFEPILRGDVKKNYRQYHLSAQLFSLF